MIHATVMILVSKNTLYVNLGKVIKQGNLTITNAEGITIFQEQLSDTNYEVITLDKPHGKYWLTIDSENKQTRKSFLLK